jgi:D-alanyl-lipoteichoic acid acyltransferase DltB (MBOAT superfamily)
MVFNSLHFVVFFVVVYALYRALPHRAQNWMLLAASYYFYAAWDWRFLGLLWSQTIVDYVAARGIAATADRRRKRAWLLLSLSFNLGMLGFFKYFDFFSGSLLALLDGVGWHVDFVTLHVLLPIGISFYTFMTISYVVDVYRGQYPAERSFLNFALFIAYFPHLVAGPILRASKLIPQLAAPRRITADDYREGAWLVLWGFFQKLFVADNLAKVADAVFAPGTSPGGLDVLLGVYAFAFQIYGDFAGYSNIARGTSRLMGIDLSVNFLYPYFVLSPRAFWRNWHVSLSAWLRDYLYIPLGGNRGGEARMQRNLMATMVLGGLWHGAAWTFVLWGFYQGLVLIAGRWVEKLRDRLGVVVPRRLTPLTVALWLLMFHVTCYGWLIFRAGSIAQIGELTAALFGSWAPGTHTWNHARAIVWHAAPLMAIHVFEAVHDDLMVVFRLPLAWRYAVYGCLLYLVFLFGDFGGAQFIYFQF